MAIKLRSGRRVAPPPPHKKKSPSGAAIATSLALASTGAVFVRSRALAAAQPAAAANPRMVEGLCYSFLALCGNTGASLLRKQVSRSSKVRPAEQVGLATAIQGLAACLYCARQGILQSSVGAAFLVPAVGSSVLNALTKTLETKAYAITDVSICAPFLAFDPVMQFLLPALFAPAACSLLGVGCGATAAAFPAYHPLAVVCVATGAYLLASVAAASDEAAAKKTDERRPRAYAGLPAGAWMILGNCCVYAVTSRLDKAAVLAAGKTLRVDRAEKSLSVLSASR